MTIKRKPDFCWARIEISRRWYPETESLTATAICHDCGVRAHRHFDVPRDHHDAYPDRDFAELLALVPDVRRDLQAICEYRPDWDRFWYRKPKKED